MTLAAQSPHANPTVRALIELALSEDIGSGDITSDLTLPKDARAKAVMSPREEGVAAGLGVAVAVFAAVDPAITVTTTHADGDPFTPGDVLMTVEGDARSVLTAERTALNFAQILSGIATLTATYVAAVQPLPVRVVDTRKTIPGWRTLSKYAVRMGGGLNHRFGLSDGVLIKDNHIAVVGSVGAAIAAARAGAPHTMRIEVEVDTLDQLDQALEAGADVVLLDNMSLDEMREAVRRTDGRALLEASGGVQLDMLRGIAETGVDIISTRQITVAAPPIDIGFDLVVESGVA
ncbi:carboxylating nicotinate-nucleotide diphosphorylase [Candidatus Poribacteria bacterium]|mgnify:CR=1 FL=1|jgi:nicotinate-nucleotide pyrophosphorylase (carboxylating)|nr:carboxylating nicotinate-nucleotide diphosphorylase [Candidatus Poribacteria bacterium]MBT5535126.1 carboxylating nicotinate-nucleotide diphosphorylase [Candidatus Poribacteria bacterium]MBT5712534.1 carboxylating nicotinate-nucleotide diphosphorylase [Candidatus Poribacteria bacterium]MBT7101473.1 carboxylating nicotinate-nucleotide diphosphorylase [Candidatus Poribacteria bacterium]MBT7805762.1 carboxylating nicotinate-nucleotide diphosphorylase [Candidatus Poribacteria bacterium]